MNKNVLFVLVVIGAAVVLAYSEEENDLEIKMIDDFLKEGFHNSEYYPQNLWESDNTVDDDGLFSAITKKWMKYQPREKCSFGDVCIKYYGPRVRSFCQCQVGYRCLARPGKGRIYEKYCL